MKKLMGEVVGLTEKELARANEQYPLFASNHEGAAVILEELEEAEYEMNRMKSEYNAMWTCVKDDIPLDDEHFIGNAPIDGLKKRAINCACECIQVAAMCEKIKMKHR